MKRYLTVLVTLSLVYLFAQIDWSYKEIFAQSSILKEKSYTHYANLYKKSTFISTEKDKYKGQDIKATVVILNFWASWCVPCLRELPSLVTLQAQFDPERLLILGINADEKNKLKKMNKIQKEYKLNFPIIPDLDGKHIQKFGVTNLPFSIILHNGHVIEVAQEEKDFASEEMIEFFKDLLL